MRIATYLNATKEEVGSKKFNIWIGCSLGNNYFTKKHLEEFILWALEHTRENVLVAIPDKIYAINLEVLDGYKPERALRVAIKKGDEKIALVQEIISTLTPSQQNLVIIARWHELEQSKYHAYRTKVLFEEFQKKGPFYEYILEVVKENPKVQLKNPSLEGLEKLAEYVLYEIPVFLNGAKYGGKPEDGGKTYSLIIYPGLGSFDYLCDGLQKHTLSPGLSKRLKITDWQAILEAYAED
jgi:tRNA-dependent cyclodipeptide synthase